MKGLTKVLAGAIVGSALTFAGSGIHKHYTSPEYQRGRELDRKAAYILPKTRSGYKLDDGREAIVFHINHPGIWDYALQIELSDQVRFISEAFEDLSTLAGDARNLDRLQIKVDDEWVNFSRKEIENYDFWQTKYEALIEEIANIKPGIDEEKARAEKEAKERVKQRLMDLESKFQDSP